MLAFVLAICGDVAQAQQPKIFKIGELTARPGLRRSSDEFVRALRELGYVEGDGIDLVTAMLADKLVQVLFPSSRNDDFLSILDDLLCIGEADARCSTDN